MNPETPHSPLQRIASLVTSITRIGLITLAASALLGFALCEIGMAFPVAWWLYFSVAIAFAGGLLRPVAVRQQRGRVGTFVAVIAIITALYFVPWTTRKPFLRDLDRVREGMTEAEVRHIMNGYMEGTGWPAYPFGATNSTSTLNDIGSGSEYSTTTSPSGEMVIQNSLVFRHSNSAEYGSDWGIVSLSSGRVVRVEFSPD